MVDFFTGIFDLLTFIFNFIVNIVNTLTMFVKVVATSLTLPQQLIIVCFPLLGTSIIIVAGVAIIKLLLGMSGES